MKVRAPKEKFFGWASYRPDLTMEIKHQEAMQLMPGMQCITPKRPDMKVVESLYGDMVASVVVSMREVAGKRSHWDIYEMKPMDTPNPNYFMNRLHVHNGPSNWPIPPSFGSELDIYGHWDVSHPASFPSPSNTIYDLTSRGDIDALVQPGSTAMTSGTLISAPARTNTMKAITMPGTKGFVITKQPTNPYHTGAYGFFGPSSFTTIMTWSYTARTPPNYGRLWSVRPGSDFDIAVRDYPSETTKGKMYYFKPPWTSVTPPQVDFSPSPTYIESTDPKGLSTAVPAFIITQARYNAPSTPGRWYFRNFANPGGTGFGQSQTEPSPSTQPRAGSNYWSVFGKAPSATATANNIQGHFSEAIFLGKAQPSSNTAELAEGILQYYNITPPGAQHPSFFWQI
jgi:hypothetical protein